MITDQNITVAFATKSDREKIYKLRYEVYSEELKQHSTNNKNIISDALDSFNKYITAKIDNKIVGFISVTPPNNETYSVDKYLDRFSLPFIIDSNLFEIRILTVVKEHRHSPIAVLLMWAAFRWIEANGGTKIMAIGRIEILNIYLKLGFKAMNQRIHSGQVTFELLYGDVDELNEHINRNYKQLFKKLEKNCKWQLGFPFFKSTNCSHGGDFFNAIGTDFKNLNRKSDIINADVLDAWFSPSPKIFNKLKPNFSWICKTSPPTDSIGMTNTIARDRGVNPENILPGAGSSSLIYLAFREWLTQSSKTLILDPTYGEYQHVLEKIIECKVDKFNLSSKNGYAIDLDKLILKAKNNYDLLVLVNPNSPTGQYVSKTDIIELIEQIPEKTRVWIDETYIEYVGKNNSLEKYATKRDNIVICKSMSKAYALSGLRSAYLCSSQLQLERLKTLTPPWSVSLPSQIAAVEAIQDNEYYQKYYEQTHILRNEFMKDLEEISALKTIKSSTNFFLCQLSKIGMNANSVVQECQKRGLYIRDVSNMGDNIGRHTIRIAVKDRETNKKITKILKDILCKEQDKDLIDRKTNYISKQ